MISPLTVHRPAIQAQRVPSARGLYFGAAPAAEDAIDIQRSSQDKPVTYSRLDNFVINLVSGIYLRVPRLPSGMRHFLSPQKFNELTGLPMDKVNVKTSDGIGLKGYWYPVSKDGKPASQTVILGHGYCATAGCMLALVEPLHAEGWNVLAFDFRAHGKSKGKKSSLGYHESKDIAAMMNWLRTTHPSAAEITVYHGHSAGASAYLMSPKSLENRAKDLQDLQHLKGVVLDSAFEVIKPSEDPYVTQLFTFKRTNRVKETFKHWVGHIVKGFETKSPQIMDLPRPLNELFPAAIYRDSAEFGKIPMLLLHGQHDTRTSYSQGEAIYHTLTRTRQDEAAHAEQTTDEGPTPATEPITFVPLNADHFVRDWKPAQKNRDGKSLWQVVRNWKSTEENNAGKSLWRTVWNWNSEYKSILRDESNYIDALTGFLRQRSAAAAKESGAQPDA